ncbi:lysosomal aspartic protease-like [Cephus cinctus]|uniref:Lysosomal aspartic protease-like n=1 Tax=Cephus cinctus TaxID=211228 RepID=A0AAJ7RVA0_CEPCN|nr:lysosomal aspartic protease-like [Cephus cinctus]
MILNTNIIFCCAFILQSLLYVSANIHFNIYKGGPKSVSQGKPKPPNPWKNDTIVLTKFMDFEYYGTIRIGQPAKEFKMTFDTSWADSWVPSARCGILEISCQLHTRYDSSKSSTYQEQGSPFEITNANFSLKGFTSMDNFHLPHVAVLNQTFVEMTHMSWRPFSFYKADGIIGLGFIAQSQISGSIPFLYNMVKQKVIPSPLFTIYMNRDETTSKAGRLILGSTERKHVKGDLTTIRIIDKTRWAIKIDTFIVNSTAKNHVFCTNTCNATIDSSSHSIIGPASDIRRINDLIGAKEFSFQGYTVYTVDCRTYAKLPHLEFQINEVWFEISSKYYIEHYNYHSIDLCLSPFVPGGNTLEWSLGGAFLMEFYTEYDINGGVIRIGKTLF